MNAKPVQVMSFDPENRVRFGPTFSDRMTAKSGLEQLGCGFMEFADSATTEAWTLRYEEVLHVLVGRLRLGVQLESGTEVVEVAEGQIVTLAEGVTVTYAAESGTRLYWSLVPQDWHSREA